MSTTDTEDLTAATYHQLGRRLRDARLARKLDLHNIARTLHIRPRYLEALEDGDLEHLPGHAFIAGYVSRYAWLLGLDAESLVEEYKTIGTLPSRQMFYIPDSMRMEQHPGWRLVALTLGMAFVLMLAWSFGRGNSEPVPMAQILSRPQEEEAEKPAPPLPKQLQGCGQPKAFWPPCYAAKPVAQRPRGIMDLR